MTMHEIRYRGGLLSEHDSEGAAHSHANEHHADIQDPEALIIAPARPVRVYCNGSLVETFVSQADAALYVKDHTTELAPGKAWWIGTEPPLHPHQIWPVDVSELDTSDEATVWAEGHRPAPVKKSEG
jgi:hypothetical protein